MSAHWPSVSSRRKIFAETAVRLQDAFPELLVSVAGYLSPLVGYLPTDEAVIKGGYEVDYAYRFYGHPAQSDKGSEPAVVEALKRVLVHHRVHGGHGEILRHP